MIDKVKISKYIELDTSLFSDKMYRQKTDDAVNNITGEIYSINCFKYKINNSISVIYSNITRKLTIEGRLININYINNKIYNYDDYIRPRLKEVFETETIVHDDNWLCENSYYNADDELCFPEKEEIIIHNDVIDNHSIDEIISNLNYEINELLGTRTIEEKKGRIAFEIGEHTYREVHTVIKNQIDIRTFKVENIEICFNVWLKNGNVSQYIELFNLIFKDKDDKRYKNFVLENGLGIDTSFYIKPKGQYEDNLKTNYVINFYNKLNQLQHLKKHGYDISQDEFERAAGLLRLEVQLYYAAIKDICNKYRIENIFNNFLDIGLCLNILKDKYNYFIGDYRLDFYSYHAAKEKIENTKVLSLDDKRNLLNHIRERQQHNKKHSYTTRNKYNKMLHSLKIYDYFIPTRFNIDYMKSPIRLLNQKLNHYYKISKQYEKGTWKVFPDKEFRSI